MIGGLIGRRSARKEQERVQQQINDYKRFNPTNAYQDMPISTMGSDIIREDAAGMSASLIDAAASGGTRGVFSALPGITRAQQGASREAGLLMDRQIQDKARMVAADEVRLQGEYLQRDRENLAGLGAQLNAARQEKADYTRGLMNLPFAAGSMFSQIPGSESVANFKDANDMQKVFASPTGLAPTSGYSLPVPTTQYGISPVGTSIDEYFNNKRQREMFSLGAPKYGL